jgi:hypothetical protein
MLKSRANVRRVVAALSLSQSYLISWKREFLDTSFTLVWSWGRV